MVRIATLLTLWILAAYQRLRHIDETILSSDSIGPYLQAQSLLFGHIPRPPNPESGDALWLLVLPLVLVADNLVELFSLRFILGAAVAPIAFAAAWHWIEDSAPKSRRWAAALAAGVFTAFDPGLIDTLISGARTYGAPELIGLTTLGLAMALRGHPWALSLSAVSTVLAIGHHPLAIGVIMGVVPLYGRLHQGLGSRTIRMAIGLGIIAFIPRLLRIGSIALCGDGFTACLQSVAQSNIDHPEPWLSMLGKAIHDRWLVDLGASSWILLAGLLALLLCPSRDHRKSAYYAFFAIGGVLLVGAINGYLRSYHLRLLAVPFAVAAGIGLARAWPIAILAATVFIGQSIAFHPIGPDPGAISRHDKVARTLGTDPIWVDRVWWDGPAKLDPSGVVLSGWLAHQGQFKLDPHIPMLILVSGGTDLEDPLMSGDGWSIIQFENAQNARLWLDRFEEQPHQQGGAYDWATIVEPKTRLEDARW